MSATAHAQTMPALAPSAVSEIVEVIATFSYSATDADRRSLMLHNTGDTGCGRSARRRVTFVLVAAALAMSNPGQAGAQTTFLSQPLALRDMGSFYIGGIPKVTDFATTPAPSDAPPDLNNQYWAPKTNQIMIGQMYVQFLIPLNAVRNAIPVINVHGAWHTGAALESTPDEKEGWAPYMARKGIPTYTVDQPGRGRSGFDHSVIHEAEYLFNKGDTAGGSALLPTVGRIPSNGAWTAWFGHIVQPDGDNTCAPSTNILTGRLSQHGELSCDSGNTAGGLHPPGAAYRPAFAMNAIDVPVAPPNLTPIAPFTDTHLGPATAGPAEYYQLKYYKQLVPNMEVTLPGSICATCTVEPLTPAQLLPGFDPTRLSPDNTWSPFDQALLVERLGKAIIATHSQSGRQGHHAVRVLKERGSLRMLKALVTIEGNCSFNNAGLTAADFDDVAYLAIVGDYTAASPTCMDSVAKIRARRAAGLGTAKAEYIKLDDPRFRGAFNGTTHMMMIGTNRLKVADVILDWIDKNVKK